MPWLTQITKTHACKMPEFPMHSDVRLTKDSKWECPVCHRIYPIRYDFNEHVLGENDYWYVLTMREYPL